LLPNSGISTDPNLQRKKFSGFSRKKNEQSFVRMYECVSS
jgi:hypothetical protein